MPLRFLHLLILLSDCCSCSFLCVHLLFHVAIIFILLSIISCSSFSYFPASVSVHVNIVFVSIVGSSIQDYILLRHVCIVPVGRGPKHIAVWFFILLLYLLVYIFCTCGCCWCLWYTHQLNHDKSMSFLFSCSPSLSSSCLLRIWVPLFYTFLYCIIILGPILYFILLYFIVALSPSRKLVNLFSIPYMFFSI